MNAPTSGGETGPVVLSAARLEAFSDGVLAIAATLLVLNLRSPRAGQDVWHALHLQIAPLLTYVVSFLTIGIVWVNHHALFATLRSVDHAVQALAVLLLLVVSFVPFPTEALGTALSHGHARPAAVLYGLTIGTGATLFFALRLYLRAHPALVKTRARPDLDRELRRAAVGPVLYLAGVLIALASARGALALYGLLAAYYFLPTHLGWPSRARPGEAA